MQYTEMLKLAFTNFSFTTPSDKLLDGRTLLYCLPVVRNIMRIATALTSISSDKTSETRTATDIEIKRTWVDIAKWAAGSFAADIFPIAFFPYIGAIAGIASLFALIATGYEQYENCSTVTIPKAYAIITSTV